MSSTPLRVIQYLRNHRPSLRLGGLVPHGVLLLLLLLTIALTFGAERSTLMRQRVDFEGEVQRAKSVIQDRITAYVDVLYGMAALFNATDSVRPSEVQHYVASMDLEQRYPGLQGIGYVRLVASGSAQEDGVTPGHQLGMGSRYWFRWPKVGHGHCCRHPGFILFPNDAPTEHYVFYYPGSVSLDWSRLANQLLRDPALLVAMAKARDSGRPTASRTAANGLDDGPVPSNFAIVQPIYRSRNVPDTEEERRRDLAGFVLASFLASEIIQDLLFTSGILSPERVYLSVYEETDRNRSPLLFSGARPIPAGYRRSRQRIEQTHAIQVLDRTWVLSFSTLPGFHRSLNAVYPITIFALGLVLSLVSHRALLARVREQRERDRHVASLQFQATHDMLTALPNRDLLYSRLRERLGKPGDGSSLFLLLFDLDGFKEINDTLGHYTGDQLLKQIGPRLQPLLGEGDMLARLGGDEFALLKSTADGAGHAVRVALSLLREIRRPFPVADLSVQIDASVGIAVYPDHASDASTLVRCADVAMYAAKKERSGCVVYNPSIDHRTPRQLALLSQFRDALAKNQLVLHYQPKLNIYDGSVVGVEALVRWEHSLEGLIMPEEFVPQVEASALIGPLTDWVIEHALRQCRDWEEGGIFVDVAVNVSARNLLDGELPARVKSVLERHNVPPARFEMEITESAFITDPSRARKTVSDLQGVGVRVSIDDFGTAYSSLSYLTQLPVSSLKIDASFVRGMRDDESNAMIVRSTVELAHNLGLHVVAEGVEDDGLLQRLKGMRCDYGQGFFLCPPLPSAGATAWLRDKSRAS